MNLGDNIPLLHEGKFWSWIRIRAALELVRAKRAQEIFGLKGEFVGIELGHFGPLPAELDKRPLPPAELPGIRFNDPRPGANYHRLVLSLHLSERP